MDQPRPGTQIARDPKKYRIQGVKLPPAIFWRDVVLTIVVWALFAIGTYNAFLYVDDVWLNRLPNPTKQQLVDIREFAEAIRFYTYFSLGVLAFMLVRLIENLRFWYSSEDEAVTLTQIPVEEQAKVFGADPEKVKAGRKAKITYLLINKESGGVAALHATNDPHFRPAQ